MTTEITRGGASGIVIQTDIPVEGRRFIRVRTSKFRRDGSIQTDVTANTWHEDGRGFSHTFSFAKGEGDYSKTWIRGSGRATEKILLAQHNVVVHQADRVKADVQAWYDAQVSTDSFYGSNAQ